MEFVLKGQGDLEKGIQKLKKFFSQQLQAHLKRHEFALSPSERRKSKDRIAEKRKKQQARRKARRIPENAPLRQVAKVLQAGQKAEKWRTDISRKWRVKR